MMRRKLSILLGLMFLYSAAVVGAQPAREPDLVIVHSNDMHARYRPFEDRDGRSRGGFARMAGKLDELRARYGDRLIYLDAGDLFQGTPFYHMYRGRLGMKLLDAMGCDAFTLGNHELDDGYENFLAASSGVSFPRLCANVALPNGEALLPASARIRAGGMDIDVVGLITAELDEVTGVVSRGELRLEDPSRSLHRWLAARGDEPDLTILLSHCGLEEDKGLAAATPSIPLIIGGHSHSFLDQPLRIGETVITTTGAYGYNLGLLKLWRESGRWIMQSEMLPVDASMPEDSTVAAMIEEAGAEVDRRMDVIVGRVAGDFDARNKSGGSDPLGQWIAELMRRKAGADIGLQNVGGYRSQLREGSVSRGDIFTLLPFDNRVLRLTFRGEVLAELFDYLAANLGGGRFGQISGASYKVVKGMARDVRIAGEPLEPGSDYTVATVDFLYGGGDGYKVLGKADKVELLDAFPRDLMEARLRAGHVPAPDDFKENVFIE